MGPEHHHVGGRQRLRLLFRPHTAAEDELPRAQRIQPRSHSLLSAPLRRGHLLRHQLKPEDLEMPGQWHPNRHAACHHVFNGRFCIDRSCHGIHHANAAPTPVAFQRGRAQERTDRPLARCDGVQHLFRSRGGSKVHVHEERNVLRPPTVRSEDAMARRRLRNAQPLEGFDERLARLHVLEDVSRRAVGAHDVNELVDALHRLADLALEPGELLTHLHARRAAALNVAVEQHRRAGPEVDPDIIVTEGPLGMVLGRAACFLRHQPNGRHDKWTPRVDRHAAGRKPPGQPMPGLHFLAGHLLSGRTLDIDARSMLLTQDVSEHGGRLFPHIPVRDGDGRQVRIQPAHHLAVRGADVDSPFCAAQSGAARVGLVIAVEDRLPSRRYVAQPNHVPCRIAVDSVVDRVAPEGVDRFLRIGLRRRMHELQQRDEAKLPVVGPSHRRFPGRAELLTILRIQPSKQLISRRREKHPELRHA